MSTSIKKIKKKYERNIYCKDAIPWLKTQSNFDSIVTSIPEMDEVGMSFNENIFSSKLYNNAISPGFIHKTLLS